MMTGTNIEQMKLDVQRIEALLTVRERACDPGFKMMWTKKLKQLVKNIENPKRCKELIS
jgi:hypothetical protein